jgi:hypothetical protein
VPLPALPSRQATQEVQVVDGGNNDNQPATRPRRSARKTAMLDDVHLYLEGTATAAIMAMLGVISGLATLALSGDQRLALLAAAVAFALTGIVLTVRLWRMTRTPAPPAEPPA